MEEYPPIFTIYYWDNGQGKGHLWFGISWGRSSVRFSSGRERRTAEEAAGPWETEKNDPRVLGASALWPAASGASARTRLLSSKRPRRAPAPPVAGCAHRTQSRRCAGSSRGGAAQARPAGGGGGGARSAPRAPRAHPSAHTLHTHLELVPGGGRGGEPKRVS